MSLFVIKASQLLLSLSILVILHEFGHYIPARLFKTRVEKFFLFFDVKFALFKKKIGNTVYGIGWLPLGGYVKIAGMIDESMDREQMKKPPQPWEFRSKPAWQRLIIMLGGVIVNFLLAVFIYIGLAYSQGEQFLPMEGLKGGVWISNPEIGETLNIQTGDKILEVDGEKITYFNDLLPEIVNGSSLTIEREGNIFEQEIPVDFIAALIDNKDQGPFLFPRQPFVISNVPEDSENANSGLRPHDRWISINGQPATYYDQVTEILNTNKAQTVSATVLHSDGLTEDVQIKVDEEGKLGVYAEVAYDELQKTGLIAYEDRQYSIVEAIPAGFRRGQKVLGGYIGQFKKILNPETKAYKGVGGFGAIGNLFPGRWNWIDFWETTALISIILAFMNVLPIPALDGGHVMFLLYEIITGRKPNEKFLEYAQITGFFLLILLFVLANGNDLYRALFS